MKQFEVVTPALQDAVEACRRVIAGREEGTMEKEEGRDLISAANGITRAVGQELNVRLAMPKLAALEAKAIEGTTSPQRERRAIGG